MPTCLNEFCLRARQELEQTQMALQQTQAALETMNRAYHGVEAIAQRAIQRIEVMENREREQVTTISPRLALLILAAIVGFAFVWGLLVGLAWRL